MHSISLCIPVYRSDAFLPDLLERLSRMDPRPAEILLLDDASPDRSAAIADEFMQRSRHLNLRIIRNSFNTGIAAAYNRLVEEAQTDWIQILDADDYPVESDFYARVAREFDESVDLIVTALDSNVRLLHWGVAACSWMMLRNPPRWIPLLGSLATRSGIIYRRARVLEQPFLDPAFPGSDVIHLLRLRTASNCVFSRRAHVFYRVHAEATSSRARNYREYRRGLVTFGFVVWFTHMLDLGLRVLGQRLGRRW